MIIINYLKLYKCLQTNDFDYIERIIWNLIIINITSKTESLPELPQNLNIVTLTLTFLAN